MPLSFLSVDFFENLLDNYPDVKELNLARNKIEEITNLDLVSSLITLDLSYNVINRLRFGLLPLNQLRVLNLSHNDIEHIEKVSFVSLHPTLVRLDLNSNLLSDKHECVEALSGFDNLVDLNLLENTADTVEWGQAFFKKLRSLQVYNLEGKNCFMEKHCDRKVITKLNSPDFVLLQVADPPTDQDVVCCDWGDIQMEAGHTTYSTNTPGRQIIGGTPGRRDTPQRQPSSNAMENERRPSLEMTISNDPSPNLPTSDSSNMALMPHPDATSAKENPESVSFETILDAYESANQYVAGIDEQCRKKLGNNADAVTWGSNTDKHVVSEPGNTYYLKRYLNIYRTEVWKLVVQKKATELETMRQVKKLFEENKKQQQQHQSPSLAPSPGSSRNPLNSTSNSTSNSKSISTSNYATQCSLAYSASTPDQISKSRVRDPPIITPQVATAFHAVSSSLMGFFENFESRVENHFKATEERLARLEKKLQKNFTVKENVQNSSRACTPMKISSKTSSNYSETPMNSDDPPLSIPENSTVSAPSSAAVSSGKPPRPAASSKESCGSGTTLSGESTTSNSSSSSTNTSKQVRLSSPNMMQSSTPIYTPIQRNTKSPTLKSPIWETAAANIAHERNLDRNIPSQDTYAQQQRPGTPRSGTPLGSTREKKDDILDTLRSLKQIELNYSRF